MDIFVMLGTMLTIVSLCWGIIYISCNWGKMTKGMVIFFIFIKYNNANTYIYLYNTSYGC